MRNDEKTAKRIFIYRLFIDPAFNRSPSIFIHLVYSLSSIDRQNMKKKLIKSQYAAMIKIMIMYKRWKKNYVRRPESWTDTI